MGRNGAYIKHKFGLATASMISLWPSSLGMSGWRHWESETGNQLLIMVCINMMQINPEEHV